MWDLIVSVPGHCLSFYFSEYASFVSFYGVPKGHCLVWGFFFQGRLGQDALRICVIWFKRIYFKFILLQSKTSYIYKTIEDLNESLRLIEFISSKKNRLVHPMHYGKSNI